jgi:hypothetical protein
MNSPSKPNPAGEDSRRDFLQKIGAIAAAAATPVAANAAPAPAPSMPMVRFGKHMISRLIIGCNPVGGLSHLSRFIDLEMKKYNTTEQLIADFTHAVELGINCLESGTRRLPLIEAVNKKGIGPLLFTARGEAKWDGPGSWQGNGPQLPKDIAKSGCISIHHGGSTDIYWRAGKLDKVRDFCKMVRDTGVLVAITSHRPEVFMEIESQGWDVDYYMTCLYKYGRTRAEWEKLFASNPGLAPAELYHSREADMPYYGGETAFTRGDPAEMFKVVKQTKKPCFVYKLLASGRLCEKPEFVEAAFKETFANIKPTDAVVVGHYTKHEDQYGINAEYVRRYGSNTAPSTSA